MRPADATGLGAVNDGPSRAGESPVQVAIDTSRLHGPEALRGIGRYVRAVVDCARVLPVSYVALDVRLAWLRRAREFAEGAARTARVAAARPDLYHAPTPFEALMGARQRWVCSILDTIPVEVASHRRTGLKTRLFYRRAAGADAVLTLSHHARGRIVERLGAAPGAVHVAPLPAGDAFRPRDDVVVAAARRRLRLPGRYVLGLADFRAPDPRKRLVWLRAVAAAVADCGAGLVLVGPEGPIARQLAVEHWPNVTRTGAVDDHTLAQLYTGAEFVVLTTAYEGQGLPALEALACGTPVLAFANSCLPEVVGGAGWLLEETIADPVASARGPHGPHDDGAARLADRAAELLGDAAARGDARQATARQAGRFSRQRFAHGIWAAYGKALGRA